MIFYDFQISKILLRVLSGCYWFFVRKSFNIFSKYCYKEVEGYEKSFLTVSLETLASDSFKTFLFHFSSILDGHSFYLFIFITDSLKGI